MIAEDYCKKQRVDRPWRDYPIGTKAYAIDGGHWTKTEHGWKWPGGGTFPTPGADAFVVSLPQSAKAEGGE